jgi:hypothetical protein
MSKYIVITVLRSILSDLHYEGEAINQKLIKEGICPGCYNYLEECDSSEEDCLVCSECGESTLRVSKHICIYKST